MGISYSTGVCNLERPTDERASSYGLEYEDEVLSFARFAADLSDHRHKLVRSRGGMDMRSDYPYEENAK